MNTDKNNAFDALRHCASTSDLQQLPVVAEALSTYLRTQDIDFSFCGINAFRHTGKTWLASKFVAAFDGRVTTYIDQPISATKLLSIWLLDQVFYRPDLEDSDILRETERLRSHFAQPVRCVLDISFAYGTLAINSATPATCSGGGPSADAATPNHCAMRCWPPAARSTCGSEVPASNRRSARKRSRVCHESRHPGRNRPPQNSGGGASTFSVSAVCWFRN